MLWASVRYIWMYVKVDLCVVLDMDVVFDINVALNTDTALMYMVFSNVIFLIRVLFDM